MLVLRLLLLFYSLFYVFSTNCELSVFIYGEWQYEDFLFTVKLEQKDYRNFDNLKKAIVDYYEKNGKKI